MKYVAAALKVCPGLSSLFLASDKALVSLRSILAQTECRVSELRITMAISNSDYAAGAISRYLITNETRAALYIVFHRFQD